MERRDLIRLWSGVLLAPLAWLLDLSISYALAGWVCRTGNAWVIDVVTVVALLVTACGAMLAWNHPGRPLPVDHERLDRVTAFMATGGVAYSAFFGLVIIATAIPNFMLRSCP